MTIEVICELFEFRLPMDLDDRVAKLKRRAFWVSLLSVIAWRRYVRSKPTTIPKVMTTASLSTLHLGHFLFFSEMSYAKQISFLKWMDMTGTSLFLHETLKAIHRYFVFHGISL